MSLGIRPFDEGDASSVWRILEPVIRAGETYTLPRDMSREDALAYWTGKGHSVYVAEDGHDIVGTYYLRANQQGGGNHVANCGYMVATDGQGKGVARAMCAHSLEEALRKGFKAIQFNFVVSTNERAIKLWQSFGFDVVGLLPKAFNHPKDGMVDANVMFKRL